MPATYEFTGVEDDDAARYAHILVRPSRPLAQVGVKEVDAVPPGHPHVMITLKAPTTTERIDR